MILRTARGALRAGLGRLTPIVVITLLCACASTPTRTATSGPSASAEEPPTSRTAVEQLGAICAANAVRLESLASVLEQPTQGTLVERGAIVAQLTGVIATQLQAARAIDLSPHAGVDPGIARWLRELDGLVAAGVNAVESSARGAADEFNASFDAVREHFETASRLAAAVRLDACSVGAG